MKREGGVAVAEASYQVVLVGGDDAFIGIGAVQVQWNKLESDASVSHDLFEDGWELVVEHLKARRETTVGEVSVEGGVSANEFVLAARFEWLCENGITVIVVEDHKVFAVATGSDGEMNSLVSGDLAGDFDGLQECHLGSDAGFRVWNRLRCHFWCVVVNGRVDGDLGGTNILLLLAKLPLGGCESLWKMFVEELRVRPGQVV